MYSDALLIVLINRSLNQSVT